MTTTMTIPLTAELHQAIDREARQQGTTPETLAAETLQKRFVGADAEAPISGTRTLADRLAPYIGALDSGETTPGGARMSERTKEYGKLLLQRHREGQP
jgi:hypothetical protein